MLDVPAAFVFISPQGYVHGRPQYDLMDGCYWNPVRGCTKISPGCKHCYAETFAERSRGVPGHPYEQGFDLRLVPEKLNEPFRWKSPRKIFVNSMSDFFRMVCQLSIS